MSKSTKRNVTAEDKIKDCLDEESYKDFLEALNSNTISAAAIARALKDLGVELSAMTVQRMRYK